MNNGFNGNIDSKKIKEAAKHKNPEKLLNSLSNEDRDKINRLLSDKKALSEILKSPKAAAIMKALSEKNRNG